MACSKEPDNKAQAEKIERAEKIGSTPRISAPIIRNRLDHYQILKYPLTTESAMKKKIEENNTLVFVVDHREDKKKIKGLNMMSIYIFLPRQKSLRITPCLCPDPRQFASTVASTQRFRIQTTAPGVIKDANSISTTWCRVTRYRLQTPRALSSVPILIRHIAHSPPLSPMVNSVPQKACVKEQKSQAKRREFYLTYYWPWVVTQHPHRPPLRHRRLPFDLLRRVFNLCSPRLRCFRSNAKDN
ncbi:hypothetical protein ZIOFF_073773 [Zingiber officinale]|uniref:Uncharacterized protein n=1 Tax=Zingiber officinale TaxID=94328 RepID=A0A8J5C7N0_ZINOF|nr:hypothetical protein ZIOFF_073773 [Zingiber officinale]